MNWTTEQRYAIELPVSNMIVSAAAGSGKTAVMAERILRRLTCDDYVDIDKILVVTYTSAAASEIKERIMKNIMDKLADGANEALSNQLLKLPYAHISTIHSFCLDLIRKYFYLLDIDPAVKIADEAEVGLLKKSAAQKVLENHYNEKDQLFCTLVSDYSNKNDSSVSDTIISIYDFSRTMPDSDSWLGSLCDAYTGGSDEGINFIMHCVSLAASLAIMRYDEGIAICKENEDCEIMANVLNSEREAILAAVSCNSYDDMKNAFDSLEFVNWRYVSGPDGVRSSVYAKRDAAKSIIKKNILDKYLLLTNSEILSDNKNVLPYVRKYIELVREFACIYSELKKDKNVIDFSDFEHLALKLLRSEDGTPTDVARSISEGFEEIYIDEYQDCNNIQNMIFEYISGNQRNHPNVFCVGDMKQSIYSFRDSNPLLFREKCKAYPLYNGVDARQSNKILLNSNFRSRDTILRFVNSVFSQIMSVDCGELKYDGSEALNYAGGYIDTNPDTNSIDIDIIDSANTFGDMAGFSTENSLSPLEAEAVHVASKIKQYISSGYMLYDKKKGITRKAEYSDIVVLLRSIATPAPVFEKVFSDMGIPVYSDKGTPYFDTEEIRFLMSLLKVIDNPDDDISLVAVLKNPVFGFDENALLKIRLSTSDKPFYDCIKAYKTNNADPLSQKINTFLHTIDDYYIKSKYMDTDEFLNYIINDLNYYTFLSLYPDSKLKKTNVRFLLRRAKEFEKNNFRGIYSFVRFVENFKEENTAESAKVLSESDNVVRIMSIHKSKGLEFPIVFVSCLGRSFNTQSQRKKIVMHRQLGIGIECIYRDASIRINTANMIAIKHKLAFESASEELRVLYVALTRATEKLILTAVCDKAANLLSNAENAVLNEGHAINPYLVFSANNFIQMLLYAIVRCDGYPRDIGAKFKHILRDGCRYQITLKNICDIEYPSKNTDIANWQDAYNGPTLKYDIIRETLDFKYKHSDSFSVPTNMTVTEIKKLALESDDSYTPFDEVYLSVPSEFGKKSRIAGAQMGTLVHYVMEHFDFKRVLTLDDIQLQLDRMCADGHVSDEEREAVDDDKIWRFFNSELGKRMSAHSESLSREYSFKYLADASDVFGVAPGEQMVIQGTIDAFFEDDDGCLVVVDYKTDKVLDGDSDIIAQRYYTQLQYYSKALEITYGKKVKEKILYLFDTDEAIVI